MKRLYLGILFFTSLLYVSTSRVKRFSYNDRRGDWNWNVNDHFADAQTKTTSQTNWPSKGSGSSTKGRGDSTPNQVTDGTWAPDGWSTTESRNDGYDMGWNTEPQGNNKGSAYPDDDGGQGGSLETILGGVPGMDFPNFVSVPSTDFDCSLMPSRGYYGDVEAGCQVFHICQPGNRKDSFLCPVGTIFNQKYFVCDWWFNVNCSDTPSYYDLNNDIYKETTTTTEAVPVTTEKTLPWNSQDLDRKRPTKSWGSQPSAGKQNPRWKDSTPIRRGSKSSAPVSTTTRDVSNSWSRSDVQKEITVSWGTSGDATSGTLGSSSTSSSSFIIPTTKPLWYGIDGQPAKDQSNGMAKRTGLAQTPAPFGTRMRKTSAAWTSSTEVATRPSSHGTSTTTSAWPKNGDMTGKWLKDEDVPDASEKGNKWEIGGGWSKGEDIPETSIHPTEIKGVWEQETTKRSDPSDHQTEANVIGRKGFVTKSGHSSGDGGRKFRAVSNQWGQRQAFRNRQNSKVSNAEWIKSKFENQNVFQSSNSNAIPRRKNWK